MTTKRLRRNQLWLPKDWAHRIRFDDPEPMRGGSNRLGLTFHDEGVKRKCNGDHGWLPHYLNEDVGIPYHSCWCGTCGYWSQSIAFNNAALALKGGAIARNGASANKFGHRNIQICLIGIANGHDYRGHKFTTGPMVKAWVLAEIMDAHKIPWRARKNWGRDASRGLAAWKVSGVHGHQHSPAPYEDHTDPGNLDVEKLFREAKAQQRHRRAKK